MDNQQRQPTETPLRIEGLTDADVTEAFAWLDDLRASGQVNMFAAPPLMQYHLGFTPDQARAVFVKWTERF